MNLELRPDRLTPDMVIQHFETVLRNKIRQFKVSESVDDCLQQVFLAMITPSRKLGTSFLDRYDPSRGPAMHYVLMFCTQQMMKMYSREKAGHNPIEAALPIVNADLDNSEAESTDAVRESELADEHWVKGFEHVFESREELRRVLAGTRHNVAHSSSPAGEPRSTLHMLELMIWEDLTLTEVANRLGVTASEVRRRFRTLQNEIAVRQLISREL